MIYNSDFLSWFLDTLSGHFPYAPQLFDAVLGNPPFIRYQYLEDSIQLCAKRIFEAFNLKFTKHTNAWVPFVVASLALLRPGGRMAMVVPSEILHVLHARSLRSFLTDECSKILIIDPEELWFDGVLQGAVLLLAEKKRSKKSKCDGVAIIPTKRNDFLKLNPDQFFKEANYANGNVLSGIKWMRALLSDSERDLMENVIFHNDVYRFDRIAEVDVGIVTGANKFFLVPDSVVEKYNLYDWAHPMFGRSNHVEGVIYDSVNHNRNKMLDLPTNFIWFKKNESSLPSSVRNYIQKGEKENLHKRYKCRIRSPWYAVPSVYRTEVGMLKRCHDFPRLILNSAGAYTTDTAYRIKVKKNIQPKQVVFSFVNSLTALSAELEGRHYGGGVLELVPSEIERTIIPLSADVMGLKRLNEVFKTGTPVDEILRNQDNSLLRPLGLTENDCDTVFSAWLRLKNRRHRNN